MPPEWLGCIAHDSANDARHLMPLNACQLDSDFMCERTRTES